MVGRLGLPGDHPFHLSISQCFLKSCAFGTPYMGQVVWKGRCRIEVASKVVWEGDPVAAQAQTETARPARRCMSDKKLFSKSHCWLNWFALLV